MTPRIARISAHGRETQDILWLVLVFTTPLLVNLGGQQPFELPKVLFVRAIVWALAAVAAAEYLLRRRDPRPALRGKPLLGAVLLLALVIAMTTVTAVDWRLSLWGSYERSQGALTLLTYLLLCLLAAARWRSPARARLLLQWMAAAAVPLLLISFLQLLGWRPAGLVSDARSPIFATLGRANFLGAYLAILAPLILALLLAGGRWGWRALWAGLLVGVILVSGLTLARGAWLGLAAGLGFFALLWWGPRWSARRRLAVCIAAAAILLALLAVFFWLGQVAGGSIASRRLIWWHALTLIAARPLLGYGADALPLVFPSVYPPELLYVQGRHFFVDRAHNLFLDWLLAAGFPGLLAYLLILVLFLTNTLRALRRAQSRLKRALLAGIAAAVMANLANNLAGFDVTPTAVATWLLIGLGCGLSSARESGPARGNERRSAWRWMTAALLLAGTAVAIWHFNGRPLLADQAARTATRALQAGDAELARQAAGEAIAHWPAEPAHYLLLSDVFWRQAEAHPAAAVSWLAEAERSLGSARRLRPGDALLWLRTGQFYSAAGQRFALDTRTRADAAFRQAVHLAPHQAAIYTSWGRAALARGEPEKGAALLRQALSLDASSGEAHVYLGAAELALRRCASALAGCRETENRLAGSFMEAMPGPLSPGAEDLAAAGRASGQE